MTSGAFFFFFGAGERSTMEQLKKRYQCVEQKIKDYTNVLEEGKFNIHQTTTDLDNEKFLHKALKQTFDDVDDFLSGLSKYDPDVTSCVTIDDEFIEIVEKSTNSIKETFTRKDDIKRMTCAVHTLIFLYLIHRAVDTTDKIETTKRKLFEATTDVSLDNYVRQLNMYRTDSYAKCLLIHGWKCRVFAALVEKTLQKYANLLNEDATRQTFLDMLDKLGKKGTFSG